MLARATNATPQPAVWRGHLAELQEYGRGWFVLMYSQYWQHYIAIYRGQCDQGIILKAADPRAMRALMNRVAPPTWKNDALRSIGPSRRVITIDPRDLAALCQVGQER
ncbi:hypothetical protein ACWEJ6_53995 [Nonomuraea sp. NPDC004702]